MIIAVTRVAKVVKNVGNTTLTHSHLSEGTLTPSMSGPSGSSIVVSPSQLPLPERRLHY